MIRKRLFALVSSCCIILALTACGAGEQSSQQAASGSSEPESSSQDASSSASQVSSDPSASESGPSAASSDAAGSQDPAEEASPEASQPADSPAGTDAASSSTPASSGQDPASSNGQSSPTSQPAEASSSEGSSDGASDGLDSSSSTEETAGAQGTVVPLGDARLAGFPSQIHPGTQEELDRWSTLIQDTAPASLYACNMNDTEGTLTAEQVDAILELLRTVQPALYDSLGNPMTGGAVQLAAYDGQGQLLWYVVYNGEWFQLAFGDSDSAAVFDGTGSGLDQLFELITV